MKRHLIFFLSLFSFALQAGVEHKDEFIETYLANISQNMDEKTQLLEHILKNPEGRFIDIGTGGDSVGVIAKQLPKNSRPTVIAADIDPLVIESIKTRCPDIHPFLYNSSGPRVELMTMSATNMEMLADSSLSGIGASALAHEIYSYTPNKSALDQFLSEACRVLEKNGVLVYRDPKWVDDPETICTMSMRSEIGKYYATLFLTRFLDREHSLIRDYRGNCCKPNSYLLDQIVIRSFLREKKAYVEMGFSEFLKTSSSDIDYNKGFSIQAPKGLLAEIQRHYLMYLRNYFPIGLLGDLTEKTISLRELSLEQRSAIQSFADRKKIVLEGEEISVEQFPLFVEELKTLRSIFSCGYRMEAKDSSQAQAILNVLLSEKVEDQHLCFLKEKSFLIDPKMLALLFHGMGQGVFQYLVKGVPFDLLEHLKMEGEEHYFYKTADELITYMGQYSRFLLKDGNKKGYCLAPIDPDYIKEAKRPLYDSILKKETLILDQEGNLHDPVTEKMIIHFQLQPERKAFLTYKKLVAKEPHKYVHLKDWVSMGSHELLDLVSNDDTVIGVASRKDIYAKGIKNFRVINAFLINSEGKLWIPTRHPSKNLFPLALDCSVGGHVFTNETYFDAFCRETEEELNLNPKNYRHQFLKKLTPIANGTSAFMEVYAIFYDGSVAFNPDDFVDGQWIFPKDLKKMLKEGAFAKTDLQIILNECFADE